MEQKWGKVSKVRVKLTAEENIWNIMKNMVTYQLRITDTNKAVIRIRAK